MIIPLVIIDIAHADFQNVKKPTVGSLKSIMRQVTKLQELARLTFNEEVLQQTETWLEHLGDIVIEPTKRPCPKGMSSRRLPHCLALSFLGNDTALSNKPVSKSAARLRGLISEEELNACYQIYLQLVASMEEARSDPSLPSFAEVEDSAAAEAINDALGANDLGITVEARMTVEELMTSLGLSAASSVPFMHAAAHKYPVSVWAADLTADSTSQMQREMDERAALQNLPDDWSDLSLKWHQLAGLHSLVRMLGQPGPRAGVLVADDVGVGKTATAIALIALLTHYRVAETSGKPLSGLLAGRIFLNVLLKP
jgi:TATA-binding protein-associated factor